jgi:hypothetical protein
MRSLAQDVTAPGAYRVASLLRGVKAAHVETWIGHMDSLDTHRTTSNKKGDTLARVCLAATPIDPEGEAG